MTTELHNRRVVRRFLEGTHAAALDLAVIDDCVVDDVVCHGFPGGNPTDRASYKAWFEGFRAGFSNPSFELPALLADGDFVAARWIVGGDHTGSFAGVPATGRRVVFDGVALYRLHEGRIAETWLYADEAALMAGIGAAPLAA